MVERRQLALAETFDNGEYGRIDETEPEIRVLIEQIADASVVACDQVDDSNSARLDVVEKFADRASHAPCPGEPIEFDDNRRRHDQRLMRLGEQIETRAMSGIVTVEGSVERTCVADQRHESGTNSMSPARLAVSVKPEAAAPTNRSLRLGTRSSHVARARSTPGRSSIL
jgi:hypothetical protein